MTIEDVNLFTLGSSKKILLREFFILFDVLNNDDQYEIRLTRCVVTLLNRVCSLHSSLEGIQVHAALSLEHYLDDHRHLSVKFRWGKYGNLVFNHACITQLFQALLNSRWGQTYLIPQRLRC
jgi:hypothetical protein